MSPQLLSVPSPPKLRLTAGDRFLSGCLKPILWQGGALLAITVVSLLAFCRTLSDVPLWLIGSLLLSFSSLLPGLLANAAISFLFRWTEARTLRRTCSTVGAILTALIHLQSLLHVAWVFGFGPKPPFSSPRQLGAVLDGFARHFGA